MAADGDVGGDDFLHASADGFHILRPQGTADLHVAVVAVGHGDVDDHRPVGEEVMHGFRQYEEQRAGIGAAARRSLDVEKLHIGVPV